MLVTKKGEIFGKANCAVTPEHIIVTIERTLLISGLDMIHLYLTVFQTLSARNQSLIGQYY